MNAILQRWFYTHLTDAYTIINSCQIISANEPRRKNEKSINNFLRLSTNRNTNLGPEKLNQWFSDKKLATLINSVDQGDRKYF